ncbi:MAG: hypothetical protein HY869_17660 [Chloroflexi bacterium]|nr:hypothetical protein [Chloroflexota bacterium]
MNSSRLRFERLQSYDDTSVIQMLFSAENDLHKTTIDIYFSIDHLIEFANQLREFPFSKNEIALAIGDNSTRPYAYLFLRAYVYDRPGHAGLEIKTRQNGSSLIASESHFTITTEVASINSFASALLEWSASAKRKLEFSLYSGFH